jgi:aminopeptidase N
LTIDKFNPQIAARLLNGLRSWRVLEPVRRKAAKRALERLAEEDSISRDTTEIVARILQD